MGKHTHEPIRLTDRRWRPNVPDVVAGVVGVTLAVGLLAWGASRSPTPNEARGYAEFDAAVQDSIVRERQRKFAEAYRADSLERKLWACRLERSRLEADR